MIGVELRPSLLGQESSVRIKKRSLWRRGEKEHVVFLLCQRHAFRRGINKRDRRHEE